MSAYCDTAPPLTLDQCEALGTTPDAERAVYMRDAADLTPDDFMRHQRNLAVFYTAKCMWTGRLGSFCPTCGEFHGRPHWWGECLNCRDDRKRKAAAEEWA